MRVGVNVALFTAQESYEGDAHFFGKIDGDIKPEAHSKNIALGEWWSAMIEVPVIAEGALTAELIEKFGPVTDFFAVGEEIWREDNPLAALKALMAPLG